MRREHQVFCDIPNRRFGHEVLEAPIAASQGMILDKGIRLRDKVKRARLLILLNCYKAMLPSLPRTYQSQSETIE